MKLCEYAAREERIAAAAELIKYMESSRESESVFAVASLADESGDDLFGYSMPIFVELFDWRDYLYQGWGIEHCVTRNRKDAYEVDTSEFIAVAESVVEVKKELDRGGWFMISDNGIVGAGHSIEEILRNVPTGIWDIADSIAYIIAEDADFAAKVLQSFPNFLAACKPIFDAVKADNRTGV